MWFADRVGDTELDDEITDCALVEHQFRKGYIRLREYLERKKGCGRQGNLHSKKENSLTGGKMYVKTG